MATTMHMRDTAASTSRGENTADLRGNASWWRAKLLTTTAGSGTVSKTINTVASNTTGLEILDGTLCMEWISEPLAAGVTISGTVTWEIVSLESNMSANTVIACKLYKLAATDYTRTLFCTGVETDENTTSANGYGFTATPTSTVFAKGDRIVAVPYFTNIGTMAGGYTCTMYYDGNTLDTNQAYVTFTETVTFMTDPSTQQLFPIDTASDLSTADVDKKIWTSRGT